MTKRVYSVLLALFITVGICSACGGPSTHDTEESLAAKKHMLVMWSDLLAARERLYQTQLWVYNSIDAFLVSHDWNDLSKARTACIAAIQSLDEQVNDAAALADLTDDEYKVLHSAGIDITYQSTELKRCVEEIQTAGNLMRESCLESLESFAPFSKEELSIIDSRIDLAKQELDCYAEYDCLMTNYLLLSLDLPEDADAFWNEMPEKYPNVCLGRFEWIRKSADIEKHAQNCLDRLEQQEADLSRILSAEAAAYERMASIVNSQNYDLLKEDICDVYNSPVFLPTPKWYDPSEISPFPLDKAGESVFIPEIGSAFEGQTGGVILSVDSITKEDVLSYLESLTAHSISWRESENKGAWYITPDDYRVYIKTNGKGATVVFDNQDITFAPAWYLMARPKA